MKRAEGTHLPTISILDKDNTMESMFNALATADAAASTSTSASNQPTPQPQTIASAEAPAPAGGMAAMFEQMAQQQQQQESQNQSTKPVLSPEDQASQTRQMLVSGLTGMPTPNMTTEDRANFEKGKAAGAVSVPVVAGAATGLTAISEALPSVLPYTIEGVKAIGAWANAHPVQAYLLYQVIRDLVPGAKKAMGFIKGVPDVE